MHLFAYREYTNTQKMLKFLVLKIIRKSSKSIFKKKEGICYGIYFDRHSFCNIFEC